ncbi:MAG: bifunctional riboflavin kinase/FAD synthetase [Verrucomicrobiota bacterium]|jgi:riboflavin kinase/FMN adenylyltransferase
MKVLAAATDLPAGSRPVCAAIGVFDGVHLGHQQVLRQTLSDAARHRAVTVAVTFDRHPNAIVAPASVPPLIYPLSKKLEVLAAFGLEAACVIRFDKPFSQIPGGQFIRSLARDFRQIETICVGDTFLFGWKRSGNVALLRQLGAELRFQVHALPDVTWDGQPVSSTRIREAVRAGDFDAAARMLGRPYSLRGPVIQGGRFGRKLGFPTANLDVTGIVVPPSGVYVAEAQVGANRWRAAVNIGHRPTVSSAAPPLQVEAHLLDFDRDIYGQELELTFLKKLRDEQKFPSAAALRAQIAQDAAQARDFTTA